MKSLAILVIVLCSLSVTHAAVSNGVPQPIVPELGRPFGTIVEIRGTISDESDTNRKGDLGLQLLRVDEIAGKKVDKPFYLPLRTFSSAHLELPKRGTMVTLRGYEEGSFQGIPQDAFKDIPLATSTGFHFRSSFRITAILNGYSNRGSK